MLQKLNLLKTNFTKKNIFKKEIIEKMLFIIAIVYYSITNNSYLFYLPFIYISIFSLIDYFKTKNNKYILKILLYSIVIPSNYIIIFVNCLIYLKFLLQFKKISSRIIFFIIFILLNILINNVRLANLLFGLLYLLPNIFVYDNLENIKNDISLNKKYIINTITDIIDLQILAVIMYFVFNYNWILYENANDWIVGTFGLKQGNIFLYFLIFSFLILYKEVIDNKKLENKIYCILIAIMAVLTNSISLIIMFFVSFLIINFIYSNKKEKKIVLIISISFVALFLLFTPKWIKNYIVNLSNPKFFTDNIPKVYVYKDTYIDIPFSDIKFMLFGNGIGQYSSRAALTCTGMYISGYNKIFKPSISYYTNKYILNRYIKYNIIYDRGTMYSPFSTIITIQGEYGLFGVLIFIMIFIYLFKKSNKYSKIFLLFFIFSCFIENYLEFSKVVTLLLMLYYLNKEKININKSKNKKIAFCINSMCKGGAERVVSILSNNLSKENNVSIITMVKDDIAYELDKKIKVVELAKSKNKIKNITINKILKIFKLVFRTIKLKFILEKEKYDLIISFLPEASFMTMLAKPEYSKVIISDRNDPKIEYNNKIYNILMKKLYPKADGYVFQTNDAKEYFNDIIDFENKKYDIIYNPVNPEFLNFEYNGEKNNEIVSVGRLTNQKNFELLIDAFSSIHSKYNDYKLVIYGEGELRESLENQIKKLGIEEYVSLPGVVSDVKNKICKSKIFVMTSNYEGMPNALIEAMCLGLAVISTDCPCGGPKMLIQNNKNGLLVDVNNLNSLTKTIELLINDNNLRDKIGKEALKTKKIVDSKSINKQWEKFINDLFLKGEKYE